jgi:superfamily II DNA or RNA helicase
MIDLKHYRAHDVAVSGCFDAVNDFDACIKAIIKFGAWCKDKNPLNDQAEAKGKGDAFEVFCEFLFRRNGLDGKLGQVKEFSLAKEDQQGVDAVGVNDRNHNVALQFKFMSDPTEVIPDERLQFFATTAQTQCYVNYMDNDNVLIIVTTDSNVRHTYEAQFGSRRKAVFVINRNDLRFVLAGNPMFWEEFRFSLSAVTLETPHRTIYDLYPHQIAAKSVIEVKFLPMDVGRGQVLIPTAGGKTRLEAEAVWQTFRNGGDIALLCIPRLSLGRQLLNDFYLNKPEDISMEIIPVASGQIELAGKIEGEFPERFHPTTGWERIRDQILKVLGVEKKVLLVSTYQSVERAGMALLDLQRNADIGVADEAHNVVSGEFRIFLDDTVVPIKRRLFFTATQKTSYFADGKGMNNSAQFGDVIYSVKPIELIKQGIIVPPKLHILDYDGYVTYVGEFDADLEEKTKLNLSMTIVGVNGHLQRMKDGEGRVVVFCQSAEEAANFCNPKTRENKLLRRWIDDEVRMFCITSDHGVFHPDHPDSIDWPRDEVLADFKAAKKAVFFHYNIISEGIDAPTITGVLFLRGVDKLMTIQATGRSLRVCEEDKTALREHRIRAWTDDVKDISWTDGWHKPYGWVIVPRVQNVNLDEASSLMQRVRDLTDYGFEFDARMVEHDTVAIKATPDDPDDVRTDLVHVANAAIQFEEIRDMVAQIRQQEIELMIRPHVFMPADAEGVHDEPDDSSPTDTKPDAPSRSPNSIDARLP